MVDFSPNLEDAEKWLPSDIYQEVILDKFNAEAPTDNTTEGCAAKVVNKPVKSAFEISTNVESSGHGSTSILKEPNQILPVHVNGEKVNGFVGSNGTGVFLPCITNYVKESKPVRRTAVLLQHYVTHAATVMHKNKKSGENKHMTQKMIVAKKRNLEREKGLATST